jgi:hypothetical protein
MGMKTKVILFFLLIGSFSTFAYDSGIAVQTDQGATMQVYVNGKLYNKQPGKFVRVRSTPGLFHLQVRVLNPYTKQWSMVKKDVHVEKGFEFQFKIVFNNHKAVLKEIRKYPVYSRYFLNPALYNRHPIS